jgi:hypothetical protein
VIKQYRRHKNFYFKTRIELLKQRLGDAEFMARYGLSRRANRDLDSLQQLVIIWNLAKLKDVALVDQIDQELPVDGRFNVEHPEQLYGHKVEDVQV